MIRRGRRIAVLAVPAAAVLSLYVPIPKSRLSSLPVLSLNVLDRAGRPLREILSAIIWVLERTPPELASDIYERGITLTGGGALLRGLDSLITQETGMPVYIAENPLDCVAEGTGKALDNIHLMNEIRAND